MNECRPARRTASLRCRLGLAGALMLMAGTSAADAAVPQRFRGRVESITGDHMIVDDRSGVRVDVQLAERVSVLDAQPFDRAAIGVGKTMAFVTHLGKDGALRADQVVALPDRVALSRDASFVWDLKPGQDVVVGGITDVGKRAGLTQLTVATREGTKVVLVSPSAPVAVVLKAARSNLKPGDSVFLTAHVDAEGIVSAEQVIISRDGALSAPPGEGK